MIETVQVSETLTLEIVSGGRDPHVAVDRHSGGIVRVEPSELRGLVAALSEAVGMLAEAEADRALSASRAVVEARRLRRHVVTARSELRHQIVKPMSPQEVDT